MGFLRGVFVLLFPFVFTLIAFVLAIITFFSSYKNATALKNINFITIDVGNLNISGVNLSSLLKSTNLASVLGVGTNGFCTGTGVGSLTECVTPHEPFYFNISELLEQAGIGSIMSMLPDDIQKYNSVMKAVSYGVWGCFLATICLAFLQCLFGFFAIFSIAASRIAEFLAGLALVASIIGSAMATGMYSVLVSKINSETSDIGVTASIGRTGLGLAWGTVAALFVADILYVISRCFASRRPRYITVPDQKQQQYAY